MSDKFEIILRVGPHHTCELPGWFRRRRLHLYHGSAIRCTDCQTVWEYVPAQTEGWRQVNPDELTSGFHPATIPDPAMGGTTATAK